MCDVGEEATIMNGFLGRITLLDRCAAGLGGSGGGMGVAGLGWGWGRVRDDGVQG